MRVGSIILLLVCGLALLLMPSPGQAATNAPSELIAVASSSTTVELKWSKGADTPRTVVLRKVGSYPGSPLDGTLVYKGSLSSCSDTGLMPGTTYYYRAFAADWVSPTGFDDPDTAWNAETNIYDEDEVGTWGTSTVAADSWGSFVELTYNFIYLGTIRTYALGTPFVRVDQIDVDARYGGVVYHDVYEGSYTASAWNEWEMEDIEYSDEVRVRFHGDSTGGTVALNELDLLYASITDYDSDMVTMPLSDEPESPDSEGPEQPSQWFQVPNADLLDSIPGSDLIDDAGDALGFPQGSMWVMVLITVAIMFGTGAQVFFQNTLIAVGVGTVAMALFGIVGILPLWIMFVFVIMGIGTAFAIARM